MVKKQPFLSLATILIPGLQVRSEFDQLLLNHARSTGASVYEQTRVDSISFSSTIPGKPISVSWTHKPPPCPPSPPASPKDSSFPGFFSSPVLPSKNELVHGNTAFTHLIDATGRSGIMSTRYLKNRHFNASLKNIAVWGYWANVVQYGFGSSRHGAPWFEALTGEPSVSSSNFVSQFKQFLQMNLDGRGLSPFIMVQHLWEL